MLKKIISGLLSAGLLFTFAGIAAAEPQNLSLVKNNLAQYHDSGAYEKDINAAANRALTYLQKRVAENKTANHPKKLAIILDIDETSLSNYNDIRALDFGGTYEEIQLAEDKGTDPAIEPTLKLYQTAKANNVAVFFITGRHEDEREITARNLKAAGYENWDGLILRDGEYTKAPAAVYKTAMRKKLTGEGYDIALNMGDQKSDLEGGYADKTFKLPNPYYLIT